MSDLAYEGVAIIGMAGRFPGAESVEEFWANLLAGKESISFFSDTELVDSGLDAEALKRRGHYVPARGILKDADCFDAAFFGVHPKEAEVIDPQQRIFLEACWQALERAGYAPNQAPGVVGVFGGVSLNAYYLHELHSRPDLLDLLGAKLVMYGNEKDYLTTRVAYKLDLKGPALNVSTACSTSLVAVCQACQSLLTYQCDMALAGGVTVRFPQKSGYYHDEGNIGSSDGHTRTFDAQASGTTFSNGVGIVVLKRLADAVNDGDLIFAVIRGAALNNDGAQRVSFGAPGVEGQSEVIAMAHALAGVDPGTITYVEAHGTATPLGDPIEVAALTKAFRLGTTAKQFCALGSVKTNIGHLDAAAGVAGLIKTALALHGKVIPASLHFTSPNPKMDFENSPFYVNPTLQEWKAKPHVPRRAGVSSFGAGGTNAHVILEEAPELPPSGPSRPWQLLMLSAKTADALDRATANLSRHLKQIARHANLAEASRELADAAFTLQTGRSDFVYRRILACQDPAEGAAALDARDPKRVFSHHQQLREPPVVFMFPGQGAQYPGMAAELYGCEPVFRTEVDRCAEWLCPILQTDLRAIIFPPKGSEKEAEQLLVQTRFTQPALFVIEYALAKLWMSWGIRPAAMIGHSVGEYVAGCLAEIFTLEDALSLVARRGALVQAQPSGAMLSVRLSENEIVPLLDRNGNGRLDIAAINSPAQCVVSGPHDAIAALEEQLALREIPTRHLYTSHAFHSSMMEPVLAPFTELVRQVKLSEPQIPYVSNVTARWITAAEAQAPEYWAGHVRQTVRFADGIAELMKDMRNVLLEVGPGQTLSTLARQHPAKSTEQTVLASLPLAGAQEPRGILEALGRLWMTGVPVDWQGFYASERRCRAVLPTYPFERKRYWPEPALPSEQLSAAVAGPSVIQGTEEKAAKIAAPAVAQPLRNPEAAPATPAQTQPEVPRKDRLLAAARSLFHDLSGQDLSSTDVAANFLDLGLDSLLLTQAAQLFHRRFGVSVTFRQLMEELCSLDAIASYLDVNLPPEAFTERLVAPTPAYSATSTVASSQSEALEQLLKQQQCLTNQLLQLLSRQPIPAPIPGPSVPAAVSTLSTSEIKPHGPFKPISRGADMALSPSQNSALESFIVRYTRRTAGSKRLAAQNRPILADPRSVAGFKQIWKELVYPIVTTRSDGSKVWDIDGNEYIDFVMGFGASMFGHRPPFVVEAVQKQLEQGFEIGPIQPMAGEVATLIRAFTGMQRTAFTNTGSEAVLAAIRLARTVSGRDKIVVFAGDYHGIFDEVLSRPLSVNGEARAMPIAPGIPGSALSQVIVLEYGNPESLEILRVRGSEIAAVIVEPVQSRRLDFQPREFLHELRRVTEQTGTALIFDEVVTGFRLHPGGAQAYFGVRADLATYGKVIGGGLPIGVVAGDAKFMDALDGGEWQYGDTSFPEVGVTFFAGTFVRHPLALAAAKAVLTHLKKEGPALQQRLNDRTAQLACELRAVIDEFKAPYHLTQFSSFMQLTFPPEKKFAGLLFYLLRERGIHIWENRAIVMTTAHQDNDLAKLTRAFRESLSEMRSGGFLPSASVPTEPPPLSMMGSRDEMLTHKTRATGVAGRSDLFDAFPLTEAQKEIWLAVQMGGDAAVAYNESRSFRFRGPFDIEAMRSAVRQVVERHPILLASISPDGQQQQVSPDARVEVSLVDLSGLNEIERERQLSDILEREVSEPFDLLAGPLLRVGIARLSNQDHALIWTAHHVVCDGWSCGLLMNELAKIYSALRQGTQPILDVPMSFREYALSTQPECPEARAAMEYWRQEFMHMPPPIELPSDRPRPSVRSAKAATLERIVDVKLYQSLKRVAGRQRTTLVVLLMAALNTLLYRLTGQTDLVVGLGVAGQAVTGSNGLVGHCVNLLPVRTRLQTETSFQENLAGVKKSVLDALDHNQCTIGSILQHLKVPRSLSRPPLVEVVFNMDRDSGTTEFYGLEYVGTRNSKRALHFDLFFNFSEGPRGLRLDCDYNTDLFDAATIDQWLTHYQVLLGSIAENQTELLDELPLLTSAERIRLTTDYNQTDTVFPTRETLHEWFECQAVKTPEGLAVTFEDKHLTYGELNHRANQLARHLRGLGVGPDILVGIYLKRSLEMMVALMGILKAGGGYVPLDPFFPQDRIAYMAKDSGMRVLVTQSALDEELSIRPAAVVRLDSDWIEIAKQSGDNLESSDAKPDNLAYVLYTSGSTGKPNGVEICHSALVNLLASMQREPGFTATDTLLAVTTLSFDIAALELYLPLISGGRLVIASYEDSRDPALLVERIRDSHCSTMQATPATWRALIDAGWNGSPTLRILCGGESLSLDLVQQLLPRCKELWNVYGPTETTIWSVIHRVTSAEERIVIGRPIANTKVFVLDPARNLVPPGAVGELYIGGAGLARGYLGRNDLTQERFVQSPFDPDVRLYRTGDLARWLPGGTLECLGRADGQVKIRGFRIELGEVEAILVGHEAVRQCAVVAREDVPGDKRLIAYYVVRGGAGPTAADLRAYLKKELPDYMVPSGFVVMDKLPLTPNGKIDRKLLPTPNDQSVVISGEFVAPQDPLEQALARIWANILRVRRVGLHDNFFELGGHSLAAVRLLSEITKLTGKTLPLATLFQASTVASLADILRRDGAILPWSPLVPIQPLGSRPALFLVHGAEGNVLLYQPVTRYLESDQPVYGLQSQGLNSDGSTNKTVQDMAAQYIKEIMTVQPHGPYFLGGYCLGGIIAFEMAQHLKALGEKVGMVIMLDTYNPCAPAESVSFLRRPLNFLKNLYFHGANALSITPEDRHKFLAEKVDIELSRLGVMLRAGYYSLQRGGREKARKLYPHLFITKVNDQAALSYVPQPYSGCVAVIRSKGYFVGFTSPSLGWDRLVSDGLEIHELPAYPKGMLVEPFCRSLAELLQLCLRNA